jgi:type IX secretion system PorP/SprF family membrane protein
MGLRSQDIHYSQFYYNYPNQSPAQTGLYNGKHRITANYRNQWLTVPVPYLSLSLFYDTKIKLMSGKSFIGLGIGFDYDKAGETELSLTSLNGSVNFGYGIGKSHLIIIGVSPVLAQRRISEERLKWNNQWNGDKFDPNRSPRESYKPSGPFFVDLAAGLTYQFAMTKRTKLQMGAALFHLLEPNQTFYGISQTKVKLPMRELLHANLDIGLGSYLDLVLHAQYQQQDEYNEKLGSGMLRLYLNKNPGIKFNLLLGCGARINDAFFPLIGFEYKDWLISGTYDINTSELKTASSKRGGPELAVQYIFRSVEPIGIFRKCPIY